MTALPTRKRKALLGVVPAESPFYHFHPLTRLLALLILAALPLFINLPELQLLFIGTMLLLFAIGRVDLRQLRIYVPLLLSVAFFMFLVSILAPARNLGDTRFQFAGVTFYYESLRWTLLSYLRLLAMLFATILYFSTNHESDTLIALRSARVPFAISYVVGLSLRAAAMFLDDFRTIRQAEQARGLDDRSLSLRDRAKLYGMYLIPLFTISLRRAEEISHALFARGYTLSGRPRQGGARPDFILSRYRFRPLDWATSLGLTALLLAIAWLQFAYGAFAVEHSLLNTLVYGWLR